ncbi:TerC family protein [Tessaracoccus sp. OH4464_COT-324]|uniref:TerC family protein n=1 Tax=Tessaracoccus sp. OH4464_COT-324 TaxID=2491059 RepID=UPI001F245650|nr:TerC family protein [Tessaracoccus sp. OH4464_COT-324]
MHEITWAVWLVTIVVIAGLLAFDFIFHVRKAHVPTLKEAAVWSAVYVGLAILFGVFVWWYFGSITGVEYFQGYVLEKALSVDNLFVFLIIMGSFKVPAEDQQKVLLFGIVFALITRSIFIFLGKAALDAAQWVFYIFGIFLLWTALHMVMPEKETEDEANNFMIRLVKRFLHTSDHYDGDKLFTYVDGKRVLTPMLLVMLAIGGTDILFAFDSIPAIYGVTTNVYLVFSATAFSLMGLRQLYFLIDGFLDRLVYLKYGLTAILAFIGIKLIIHALHENNVPFINGGEPVHLIPEIDPYQSLVVVAGLLVLTIIASLLTPSGRVLSTASALHREACSYVNLDIAQTPEEREAQYQRILQLEEKLGRYKDKLIEKHTKDDHDQVVDRAHALHAAGR